MAIGVSLLLGALVIWLLIRYHVLLRELRSLERQLEEIERGSQMELGIWNRQRELLALYRRLNGLQGHWRKERIQYERAERQLKQNITSLAHDIRTPLTGAVGYVQLAQECREAEQQTHYLQIAEERLRELGDMLEELFLYTKLTSEDFEPSMQTLQVLPLLGKCLVGLYHQFEETGLSPEVEFEAEGVRVWADEECLRRIFHNLIQNALVHGVGGIVIRQRSMLLYSDKTAKGASDKTAKEAKETKETKEADQSKVDKVTKKAAQLEAEAFKRMVCLEFENRIPVADRPDPTQIFDRFYKADSARHQGSSGLGLFIVKELVERMGGNVSAELEGEKLRITVYLQESLA